MEYLLEGVQHLSLAELQKFKNEIDKRIALLKEIERLVNHLKTFKK